MQTGAEVGNALSSEHLRLDIYGNRDCVAVQDRGLANFNTSHRSESTYFVISAVFLRLMVQQFFQAERRCPSLILNGFLFEAEDFSGSHTWSEVSASGGSCCVSGSIRYYAL